MIVYQGTKASFHAVAHERDLGDFVHEQFQQVAKRRVGEAEIQSWRMSLEQMSKVLNDDEIPDDVGVAIEFQVPPLRKRIDFLISGLDETGASSVAIVELKQWSDAKRTDRDGIVTVRGGHGIRESSHPSYQAWSYAETLRGYSEPVANERVKVQPCAYLHNHPAGGDVLDPFYAEYLAQAPLFLRGEEEKSRLRRFIKRVIRSGDGGKALFELENGKVRPSKALVNSVVSMLEGNREFILLDEQKVAFEAARALWSKDDGKSKRILIIEGGPGTGKSVIAIHLLVAALRERLTASYVSKNAAPRAVFKERLAKSKKRNLVKLGGLFVGSGDFIDAKRNECDVLIVDEAHRLREKSGLYGNLGEHQIAEIINAGRRVVFLLDERQRVTIGDVGGKREIERLCARHGVKPEVLRLDSQYRCAGSDAFVSWVEKVLALRAGAHAKHSVEDARSTYAVPERSDPAERFELRVCDTPGQMQREIEEMDRKGSARMVAGYCWNWISKKDPSAFDVTIPEHGFRMRWNLVKDGSLWMVSKGGVQQVGCIHTSQGLEVEYIGVILGPDLVIRNGEVVTDFNKRARTDISLKGIKKLSKADPIKANAIADEIIKNTYFTLMTRGMKGCLLFSTDPETQEFLKRSAAALALNRTGSA